MEAAAIRNSSGHRCEAKREKRNESPSYEEDDCNMDQESTLLKVGNGTKDQEDDCLRPLSPNEKGCSSSKQLGNGRKYQEDDCLRPLSPNEKDCSSSKQDVDQLAMAKAEMGEVREENQRLKMYLDQMMKDYKILQKEFQNIVHQESKETSNTTHVNREMEEPELVSLSLGRTSSTELKKDEKIRAEVMNNNEQQDKECLELGLDCKFKVSKTELAESSLNPSPENSLEEVKKEEGWPPHKVLKTMRSGEDEVSQQNPTKRARVSVRVRCDTTTMNDGCQWRKYGQKIAKGNPCPRAYYRCTVAPSCPVRKQVQRCCDDMSILITTYEGKHNHPLPMSATAMASTTSAAASMLMSGSSSSAASATTAAEVHGLNFYLSDNSESKPFYLMPNSLVSSPSPSCPTITLDLTSNTSSSASHFNRMSTNFPPRYSTTNLNFSSFESNAPLPITWSNGTLNYGAQPYGKNQIGSLNFGRNPEENIFQSYMHKNVVAPTQQSLMPDGIEAATKAITSDPSFQSALVAALTSIIGSNGNAVVNQGGGDKLGQNLKLGDNFPVLSASYPSTSNANNCTSSYLNKSQPNSQPRSLMFLPHSLPFPSSKSKSTSPDENS